MHVVFPGVHDTEATPDVYPLGHELQKYDPVVLAYVPAAHAEQDDALYVEL